MVDVPKTAPTIAEALLAHATQALPLTVMGPPVTMLTNAALTTAGAPKTAPTTPEALLAHVTQVSPSTPMVQPVISLATHPLRLQVTAIVVPAHAPAAAPVVSAPSIAQEVMGAKTRKRTVPTDSTASSTAMATRPAAARPS